MSKESNTSEDLLLVQIEQTCHLSPQRQVQRQKEIWMSKISVVYALGNCAKLSYRSKYNFPPSQSTWRAS